MKEGLCKNCWTHYDSGYPGTAPTHYDFNNFCSWECARLHWISKSVPQAFAKTDFNKLPNAHRWTKIEQWIRARQDGEGKPGLILFGARSGTGKTRMATLAASHLAVEEHLLDYQPDDDEDEWSPSLWVPIGQVKRDRSSRGVDDLIAAPVAVIDDMDKVSTSDRHIEVLYEILDSRLHSDAHTILTTNCVGAELERKWKEYGKYLVRRLAEFCETVDFDAKAPKVKAPPSNVTPLPASA